MSARESFEGLVRRILDVAIVETHGHAQQPKRAVPLIEAFEQRVRAEMAGPFRVWLDQFLAAGGEVTPAQHEILRACGLPVPLGKLDVSKLSDIELRIEVERRGLRVGCQICGDPSDHGGRAHSESAAAGRSVTQRMPLAALSDVAQAHYGSAAAILEALERNRNPPPIVVPAESGGMMVLASSPRHASPFIERMERSITEDRVLAASYAFAAQRAAPVAQEPAPEPATTQPRRGRPRRR